MEKLFNLRHILVAVILASSTAFAIDISGEAANQPYFDVIENNPTAKVENTQPGPILAIENSTPVVAPLILKETEDGQEMAAGAVVVDPTPQPENALEIIRDEMQKIQMVEQEKHTQDGWFKSTNKRFAPESMTFFVAIGLVTYNSMWIKSHGDPLAMERHIMSLKDPIAHLSFYSFMIANGFYIDFRTKGVDPMTKAQMMRRLSYQGMAVGSLASSLVSDLGHSGQMCVDYWIMGRNDEKSIAACTQAWKHWTVRNKFQQYFPQIMAMWASQAGTEIVDRKARNFFTKLTTTEMAKKFLSKEFLVKTAHKIVGVDTVLTFAGGTWSMKVLRWAGKLTQFTMFVAVDHAMSGYTYRPLNNLLRPLLFDFDALAINNYMGAVDKINWDDSRLAEASKDVCSVRNPNCLERRLLEEIEGFGSQMQQWREHLNSDAEMDISGWMEMTKKILNQIDYSYKFYKSFVSNMFETLNYGYRFRTNQGITQDGLDTLSRFPFRTLPLYGVGVGEYKATGNIDDLYLTSTAELERKQKMHVAAVAAAAEKQSLTFDGPSLEKYKSILTQLKSDNVDVIGKGLTDINQILGVNSLQDPSNKTSLYTPQFMAFLAELRSIIGNPMPVVYPFAGFTQAFSANSTMSAVAPDADFSLWSVKQKYMFNKEADLMTYRVFCGPEKGLLEKHKFRLLWLGQEEDYLSPQFNPPRLLNKSQELDAYCGEWRRTRELKVFNENLYGQKIGDLSMQQFFLKNFNYNVMGDYRNKENAQVFEKWWLENGRQSMDAEFKKYDQQFKELNNITQKNIFTSPEGIVSRFKTDLQKRNEEDKATGFSFAKIKNFFATLKSAVTDKQNFNEAVDHLNQSKYLKSNIKENLQFETNFYLQIIARALDNTAAPMADKYSFLSETSKQAADGKFVPVSRSKNLPELQAVMDLINSYFTFIQQDKVSFDQYIAHSKKIDTAINDLLVLAKLKNCSNLIKADGKAAAPAELGTLDFSMTEEETAAVTATPSATGTETSPKTYTDVEVAKPTLRQKAIIASVKGLREVESEIRRFIRMKIALAQGLELDTKEFMDDWNNTTPNQNRMSAPAVASPYGQRAGG